MNVQFLKGSIAVLFSVVLVGLFPARSAESAREQDKLNLDQIPKKVIDALMAKFPLAVIDTWTKEKEGGIVIYDLEFKQEGQKFEADIKEDGGIYNWETAVAAADLPEAVLKAVEARYPKSTFKEIMQITAVIDGKDALEGYEVVLETVAKEEVEITVAPDGKILEDSGDGE